MAERIELLGSFKPTARRQKSSESDHVAPHPKPAEVPGDYKGLGRCWTAKLPQSSKKLASVVQWLREIL